MRIRRSLAALGILAGIGIAGCGTTPVSTPRVGGIEDASPAYGAGYVTLNHPTEAEQLVMYAYGLIGTGYQFGGRNPEAGLDCSGMVSYIVEQVSGKRLPHNAAKIAQTTRPIKRGALQPGDLVFFNTLKRPHSHMGVYLGDNRFLHAPNSRGSVRIDSLANRYWSRAFDGARTLQPEG